MNWMDYKQAAMRTSNSMVGGLEYKVYALLKQFGEIGEIADVWAKHLGQGHNLEITKNKLKEEIGDAYWQVALAETLFPAPKKSEVDDVSWELWLEAKQELGDALATIPKEIHCTIALLARISGQIAMMAYMNEEQLEEQEMAIHLFSEKLRHVLDTLCASFNWTPEEIQAGNLDKLWLRYPKGFEAVRSSRRYE